MNVKASVWKVFFGWCAVGALIWASEALYGCPGLPKPDGCTPLTTRCSPEGKPQVCSQTQRWTEIGSPCSTVGAVCCRVRSPYGHELYACSHQEACLPEPDAGVASDGGDQ